VKTGTLEWTSSAIEVATGIALIALPEAVARLLLGTSFAESGIAVARLTGCALLSLGLGCWPGDGEPTPQATRALFVYNLLAGLYLGYLRVDGGFAGILLWPASALHVLLAVLLARPAIATLSR